jgi:N utilization substance protein B
VSRRQARERALQVLFQVDLGGVDPRKAMQDMDENFGVLPKNADFAEKIVFGTLDNLELIDQIIASISKEWDLKRMASVDRNIMRLALYEILYCRDIPGNVSVNEAVELGKVFGGEDSGRFINGILGKVLEKPEEYRTPPLN